MQRGPRFSRESKNSINKKSKISNLIESNTTTADNAANVNNNVNFNIPSSLLEKLEKEGMVSYESSPVNTDKNQEESSDNNNNKANEENNILNIEMEKEIIAKKIQEENFNERKPKEKSIKNKKNDEQVIESIFIQSAEKNENRTSLFRGNIFILEAEQANKVNLIFIVKEFLKKFSKEIHLASINQLFQIKRAF